MGIFIVQNRIGDLSKKIVANHEDYPEEETAKSDLFLTQYHTEIQTWKQTARKSNRLSGGLFCRFRSNGIALTRQWQPYIARYP